MTLTYSGRSSQTYAIPSISALLWRTGQLAKLENSTASRRYVDTSLLIDSFVKYTVPPGPLASTNPEDGPQPHIDDPRGAIAIARMNYIHSRYGSSISNDDLLYTLSVFVLEPAKWYARYEWRALSPLEKEANYVFYAHVGRCMGIQYIPESLQELVGWSEVRASDQHTFPLSLFPMPLYSVRAHTLLHPRPTIGIRTHAYGLRAVKRRRCACDSGFANAPRSPRSPTLC